MGIVGRGQALVMLYRSVVSDGTERVCEGV